MYILFHSLIKAEEVPPSRGSATAILVISVMSEDLSPPVLLVSSLIGEVDENSEVGKRVVDQEGNDVRFTVTDKDLVRKNILNT